jgi:hypothetical protein
MKGTRTRMNTVFVATMAAILLLSCLWLPSPGLAVMALPDIGIDYSTMRVAQAAKLTGAGMANAQNGDAIAMRLVPSEGKIIFKNIRTNEELAYPPARQKVK